MKAPDLGAVDAIAEADWETGSGSPKCKKTKKVRKVKPRENISWKDMRASVLGERSDLTERVEKRASEGKRKRRRGSSGSDVGSGLGTEERSVGEEGIEGVESDGQMTDDEAGEETIWKEDEESEVVMDADEIQDLFMDMEHDYHQYMPARPLSSDRGDTSEDEDDADQAMDVDTDPSQRASTSSNAVHPISFSADRTTSI